MAGSKEIRTKIKSVQNTRKITKAMELISASRIAKAQQRVAASLPYARAVTRAASAVAAYANVDHILTQEAKNPTRAAVVVLSSDRGLAGAFNANVLRMLSRQSSEEVHFRATVIFTRVDVVANVAVIVSGVIVLATGFRFVDLAVGAAIGTYVVKEAAEILSEARAARKRR